MKESESIEVKLEDRNISFIHKNAIIDKGAYIDTFSIIGKGVKIESGVYISNGVKIYGNALIQSGTYIGENCIMSYCCFFSYHNIVSCLTIVPNWNFRVNYTTRPYGTICSNRN